MKFIKSDGKLCIYNNDKLFFGEISAFMSVEEKEKQYLELSEISDTSAKFRFKDSFLELIIKGDGDTFSLHCQGEYKIFDSSIKGRNHLNPDMAFGIDIKSVGGLKRYIANYLHKGLFWCATEFCEKLSDMPDITQTVVGECDDGYIELISVCDKNFKTAMQSSDSGFTVYAYSHYPENRFSECVLVIARSSDVYLLPEKVAEYGLKVMEKSGKLRNSRRYPEIFEYLGWCSWDAFHMDVTHNDLLKKAEEFKEKNIPVRWMLIDDMWAECPGNNRETMGTRELKRFEGDPERFPEGLKGAISDLKEQYGVKVGVWHPTTGYWNGIDPNGEFAEKYGDTLTINKEGLLIPSPEFTKSVDYFRACHSFLRECDADFVKVDNQAFINRFYDGLIPIGKAAENLHNAIETTAGAYFDGNLINCMGMATENFWNRPLSLVNRASDDFQPEDRAWFIKHILQCGYNAYLQGSLYTSDWDMWWSDDGQAVKNAVLRAISGGPVYVSDELSRSVKSTIMPIVYSDGKIIRLKNPARPTADCIFSNPQKNGKPFKVFNTCDNGGIIASFNLDEKETEVSGTVSKNDIYGMDFGETVLVDYFNHTVITAEKTDITLRDYDDFSLIFVLCKEDGAVPVGLIDKYMSPATYKRLSENSALVYGDGEFAFCCKKPNKVIANGKPLEIVKDNDLFTVDLSGISGEIFLEWE